MNLDELFTKAEENPGDLIKELQSRRNAPLPDAEEAAKQLDPSQHDIFDRKIRPDKWVKVNPEDEGDNVINVNPDDDEPKRGYRIEKVARIAIALQKLIVKRAVAFLFGNPVKLNAEAENKTQKKILKAIKRILFDVKADSLNRKIARQVFSCCECAELWYPVPVDKTSTGNGFFSKIADFANNLVGNKFHVAYGFKSKYKLRVAVFSPLLGDTLYPYFDETGDLVAFSRQFTRTDANNVEHSFFETYTDTAHYLWENTSKGYTLVEGFPKENAIGKIPIVYAYQDQVEWSDVQCLIDRLEKLLSNFADTNDYHASPKIFVQGELKGFSKKGEAGAIIEGEEGSTAQYLAWQHAPESVKLEIQTLLQLIYTITQTPDLSFDAVKGVGAISGVALKLLFMDAHLKVADKQEVFDEYMQRRVNIIKAFVGKFDTSLSSECDSMEIEPEITPYMIEDEMAKIKLLTEANGGVPVISQKRSFELADMSNDSDADFLQYQDEEDRKNTFQIGEPTEY